MKIRNPIIKKILIIFLVLLFAAIVVFFVVKTFLKSYNDLTYDIGQKDIIDYNDIILTSYDEYSDFVKDFNIQKDLNSSDFKNSNYLVSFQEFDKCSEKQYKSVENISNSDGLNITYKVYNKCGQCKGNVVIHIIKVGKVDKNSVINYDYVYLKENLDCGSV